MGAIWTMDYYRTKQLQAERDTARAEAEALREVLREVEWGGTTPDGAEYCVACWRPQYTNNGVVGGHAPDCKLAKALEGKE